MPPVLVAFPECFTRLGGNQYINSAATGAWEDFLLQEMLPAIEQRYGCGGPGRRGVYQVHDTTPQHRVLSRQEVEEELKLRGLPTELLAVLRAAPAPLDPGEIENPYDIEIIPPDTDDTGAKP
jgi:hypothetical protein